MSTADTIGAYLTLSSTRTLYWTVETDVTVTGNPAVAIISEYEEPGPTTVWTPATWTGPEVVTGNVHTRVLSLLVAGPNGPTTGSPKVVPTGGEYSTWVRFMTSTEQIEVPGQLLVVG